MESIDFRTAFGPIDSTSHTGGRDTNPFTSNERNVVAKTRSVLIDQFRAMIRLLLLHFVEHLRRSGIVIAQALGEFAVYSAVFFFESYGYGQDFPLG